MNDEIKEILDYLKEFIDEDRLEQINLNRWFVSSLLDYITNLQQQLHQASLDIQELTERDIECPSWCDKLTNLDEKNKELKKKITFNEKSRRKMQQSLMEKIEDYKSRIEKAVEYIKENAWYMNKDGEKIYDRVGIEGLLDILNGRSDE